ncbi:MAG: WcaF family extracellular polysaccharide biosynthesis acetyltransferase [Vicingaceae bacterium]
MKAKTNLSSFNNHWYSPGASVAKRLLWYVVNAVFLNSYLLPINSCKVFLLKLFGANVGIGCVIKPKVNIKYPWKLSIGEHSWIGEKVWIDSLAEVSIGANVCISQGAMLLCGNHNYKKSTFDLMVGAINIKEGAWIGAQSVVCPSVTVESHAVLTVGSIATSNLSAYTIYQGNPAKAIKKRTVSES